MTMTKPIHPYNDTVLVGNPFFPTGRGGTVLSFFRAFHAIGINLKVCDAFSRKISGSVDPSIDQELQDFRLPKPGNEINIYHLNADEVDIAQMHLQHSLPDDAYNIIYPFWELNNYPPPWLEKLKLFNEIWAPSLYIQETLKKSLSMPVHHMPLPIQLELSSFLGRRDFDLPESAYIFLFSFDFRSYLDRKNPGALLDVFERICRKNLNKDFRIVIKIHGAESSPRAIAQYQKFTERIQQSAFQDRAILINQVYSDNQIKNLIRCCDCFISLHRAEGFGLGMAEAMYLGKPVIATAYSGNLDFMTKDNSCLVDYELIPVEKDQYPFAEGQVWANPDREQAVHYMQNLLDDRDFGRQLGRRASQYIRSNFSYLALGLRYRRRLEQILQQVMVTQVI